MHAPLSSSRLVLAMEHFLLTSPSVVSGWMLPMLTIATPKSSKNSPSKSPMACFSTYERGEAVSE